MMAYDLTEHDDKEISDNGIVADKRLLPVTANVNTYVKGGML